MHPKLWDEIEAWRSSFVVQPSRADWFFPSQRDTAKPCPRQTVDHALRMACRKFGFEWVLMSALTAASSKGLPLRVFQSDDDGKFLEETNRLE